MRARRGARGVTLVEVMVALTIGLMISLAAAVLYLGVRETSRGVQAISDINQTGKLALDIVGREIEKAGFYPAEFSSDATSPANRLTGAYSNIENPTAAANLAQVFNQGVFGCSGATFDPTQTLCVVPTSGPTPAPDSIVVNYFSSQEFGANALMGSTNDCNRSPVTNDSANTARTSLPLFVSNRFALVPTTMSGPDGSVSTNSLGCNGNGAATATSTYQPLLQGIDDMVIGYGIYSAAAGTTQFYAASSMTTANWPQVSAVRLCFIVRSIDNNVRQADQASQMRTKPSCRNTLTTPATALAALPASDHYLYKKFEQVFATRNYLP